MKEDILKKFVDANRDQFDDQSPDADILGKLQAQLGLQPAADTPKPAKVIGLRYWWVAAATITAIIGVGVLLQRAPKADRPIASTGKIKEIAPAIPTPADSMSNSSYMDKATAKTEPQATVAAPQANRIREVQQVNTPVAGETTTPALATDKWQAGLQNESSSVRLAAVLASGKSTTLSDDDMKSLYFTMNNDESSNVRLAALEVLKKREKAGNLILASVDKQDDPVVQMELLASLSPAQAVKVEQQLLEITQNPLTIDAVRNEAYAVLLRSNTNF